MYLERGAAEHAVAAVEPAPAFSETWYFLPGTTLVAGGSQLIARPLDGRDADESARRKARSRSAARRRCSSHRAAAFLDYFAYVKRLVPEVKGKVVEQTTSGSSGFLLRFSDGGWVASFFDGQVVRYKVGRGETSLEILDLMTSPSVGDGSNRLSADLPYADEACDIASEVAKCEGMQIISIAFGADCFNFCFPGRRELETMLVPDESGKLALRVFWEQW